MTKNILNSIALLTIVTGCGGGSNSQTNSAPVFTSATAATTIENNALAFQVAATDANGQSVSFSIAGGDDAASFSINGAGTLNFTNLPNFDNPADADGNNIYLITLAATDGQTTTTQALSVTVTNSREGISVRRLFTGFNQPVAIAAIPGDRRLFVGEKDGSIWFFDPATNLRTLYTLARPADPISGNTPLGVNGLLGMVPAPDYVINGNLFVAVDDQSGNIQIRTIFRNAAAAGIPNNSTGILRLARGATAPTPAAWLGIGPDNNLYLSTGDAGGQNDPANSAQNDASQFGKLIRIRRNPDPFAGASVGPLFFFDLVAKGLRQPSSFTFFGSEILIGDRGQSRFGEINRMTATGSGINFGWPFREGNVDLATGARPLLTDAALQVAFGTGPKQGNAITLGQVFQSSVQELRTRLIFSDANGSIWTVPTSSLTGNRTLIAGDFERRNEDFVPDVGSITGIVAFATGNDGRSYLLDRDGEIFEIVAAP